MEPEVKEDQVTRNILSHLGLQYDGPCSKLQMEALVRHTEMSHVLHHWACAESFATWAALVSDTVTRVGHFSHLGALYSVVPGYRGNALHHAAQDRRLQSPERMPYAVAMLRYMGCDFDSQEDSRGQCANVLVARAMGSHNVFVPASLLLRWLYNRNEPHYAPCEQTRALLKDL